MSPLPSVLASERVSSCVLEVVSVTVCEVEDDFESECSIDVEIGPQPADALVPSWLDISVSEVAESSTPSESENFHMRLSPGASEVESDVRNHQSSRVMVLSSFLGSTPCATKNVGTSSSAGGVPTIDGVGRLD